EFVAQAQDINGFKVLTLNLPNGVAANDLRTLATDLRNRLSNDDAIVVLASENDGKLPFIAAATKSAVARGVKSGDVVKLFGGYVDGRGGGSQIWRRVLAAMLVASSRALLLSAILQKLFRSRRN